MIDPQFFFEKITGKFNRLAYVASSRLMQTKFTLINKFWRRSEVADADDAELIVSMTTYQRRLEFCFLSLESIFDQDVDMRFVVYLYLSLDDIKKNSGQIPDSLKRLERRGLRIVIVSENFRSYKKLVYLLASGKPVVTADDDVFYPRDWLQKLVDSAVQLEWKCVIASRAHMLRLTKSGNFLPYSKLVDLDVDPIERMEPSFSLMPTGVGGVLYPVGSLIPDCGQPELFLECAPHSDDVWFKAHTLLAGFKSAQCLPENPVYVEALAAEKEGLYRDSSFHAKNDLALKKTFDQFPQLYELIDSE